MNTNRFSRIARGMAPLVLLAAMASLAAAQSTETPGTGPRAGAPHQAQLWRDGDPGQRLHLRARVVTGDGDPVAGANVRLWQADGAGRYREARYRARLVTDGDGEFSMITAVPGQYRRAKHIHYVVSHPDHRSLTSRILFKGDPHLRPGEETLAIPLEEIRTDDGTVMVGDAELVLEPR